MTSALEKYEKLLNDPKFEEKLFNNDNASLVVIKDVSVIQQWIETRKKELASNGFPEDWAEIGVVFEDAYITVLRDLVQFPSGRLGSYFRIVNSADLRGGQGTVVLPVIENKILLIYIYRHSIRSWCWEIPRGFGEPNTPPEENARKEIQEEVQGEVKELVDLGSYHSNTGAEANNTKLFLAKLSRADEANIDEGISQLKLVSVEELERMIRDAEITDGFTIAAYTRAKLMGLI
jgi:ADP-ribose pyrophosphatase